ncbi:MAG TPA: hypothetical protein VM843_09705, partial [Flavisolibacter sp.]|nr:hypothetical protein [Flavisolibacter sp.]
MEKAIPEQRYKEELKKGAASLQVLKRRRTLYGWMRLGIVVAGGITAYFAFQSSLTYGWVAVVLSLLLFLVLLHFDTDNGAAIGNTERLIAINEDELKVLAHRFHHRDTGAALLPSLHDYAGDLDVLGNASLFQYISRCHTEQGSGLMAHDLLYSIDPAAVVARQEAAGEMGAMVEWRQQFSAHAMHVPVTVKTEERIRAWLSEEHQPFSGSLWQWALPLYSILTIGSAVAAIAGYIPGPGFSMLFFIYVVFASLQSRKATGLYAHLSKIVPETQTLGLLLKTIEDQSFKSSLLKSLQQGLSPAGGSASREIKALKAILGRFDLRLNMFLFIALNSFLLWDVRQARALAAWKRKNGTLPANWFRAIAETEVIISLGTLHFNQPSWSFPKAVDAYCLLEGKEIGHPLLPPAQRVTSNFSLQGQGRIALITGSNMAGKSTFLRSLGVNLVLAQMGAPVCAQDFRYSP